MSKHIPEYDFNEFVQACSALADSVHVSLEGGVLRRASRDFSLHTKKALLSFISRGGCEKREFINSIEYRRSRDIPPPFCDAYTFISGYRKGYISFFFSRHTESWIIKSFHLSDDDGPTQLKIALRKAGLLPDGRNRHE